MKVGRCTDTYGRHRLPGGQVEQRAADQQVALHRLRLRPCAVGQAGGEQVRREAGIGIDAGVAGIERSLDRAGRHAPVGAGAARNVGKVRREQGARQIRVLS